MRIRVNASFHFWNRRAEKKTGYNFGVCVNPEFLREGFALKDFQNSPFTIIGQIDKRSGDVLESIYADLSAPIYRVEPDVAAMVKYASNAFHALKVTFANEIGAICQELEVDGQTVMEIFRQDGNLNISAAYLKPGFAFGGSCLPKDVRALLYVAKHRDVQTPLISAILPSNDIHIQRAVDQIVALNKRNVALPGLSFKPGTDDLRESPFVRLAEILIGKGYQLSIYDEEVSLSKVFGRNRQYIEQVLPHINKLLRTNLQEVIDAAQVLVIGKRSVPLEQIRARLLPDQVVIDLVHAGQWHRTKRQKHRVDRS